MTQIILHIVYIGLCIFAGAKLQKLLIFKKIGDEIAKKETQAVGEITSWWQTIKHKI
jgi:hypothetical protein